jgi:predicted dithiol-disulfide oxidoreductase (DUF899 family)
MTMEKPKIVTVEEWQQARDELLAAEKEATRALDSLAARRRRIPMVFSRDTGAGDGFLLSVFLRDGENIYRTYTTTSRGIDKLAFVTGILDLTPYGRQEEWEDSPPGWPQNPTSIIPNTMELGRQSTGFGRFR